MSEHKHPVSWPGWERVRRICGQGSGSLWELQRKDGSEQATVKYISVPRNPSETVQLLSQGQSREQIADCYEYMCRSIDEEFTLSRELKDCRHVVLYRDMRKVRAEDGLGFQILLRMEHLLPIDQCICEPEERELLKLGRQICLALEDSSRHGLLHGGITPRCIFRDDHGDYQLGGFAGENCADLGDFRAPEAAEGHFYDIRADVYSLGLTLYWLLNDRKLPGKAMVRPRNGSEKLKAVVMKAIAANPEERYRNPEEMRAALESVNVSGRGKVGIPAIVAAVAVLLLGLSFLLKGKEHTHIWHDATCTSARICEDCGETEGTALGHSWEDATCTTARTCTDCGETEGAALGHSWEDATCTTARICTDCGETEGAALGHSWEDATCTTARICKDCGETEGAALGHSWMDATRFSPRICKACSETEGKSLGYSLTECQVISDSNEPGSTSDICLGTWTDTFGGVYYDSLRFWVVDAEYWAEKEYIKYQLDGSFAELVLTMAAEKSSGANTRGKFYVYSEDGLLFESEWISISTPPVTKTIDISGCEQLQILCVTDSSNYYYGIAKLILYN